MLNNNFIPYKSCIILTVLLLSNFRFAHPINNASLGSRSRKIKHMFVAARPSMNMSSGVKRKKIYCGSVEDSGSDGSQYFVKVSTNDTKPPVTDVAGGFVISHQLNNENSRLEQILSDDEMPFEETKLDLEPCKKISTPKELESYFRLEERTKVIIEQSKIALFAQNDLFRNVVRNKANSNSRYMNDDGSVRSYLLKGWDLLPETLRKLIETDAVQHFRIYQKITYHDLTARMVMSTRAGFNSLAEAFKLISDDDENFMIGFETVGHIAHLNITEDREAVKTLIAKIIIDKFNNIKTVVNKRSELSNEFRTIDIEHLAGEKNYVTNLVENGFKFELDYQNVYWNSRLIQERNRISALIGVNDIVVDMFAGVGPFAIYASKKGCHVFANDLNPIGVEYMNKNVKLNRVESLVKTYNMDAREFLKGVIKKNRVLDKTVTESDGLALNPNANVHFLMNLPKLAITYLDAFVGLADNIPEPELRKCIVHCYCFERKEGFKQAIQKRIEEVLGDRVKEYDLTEVRNVAPSKQMYCIEFECPPNVLTIGD